MVFSDFFLENKKAVACFLWEHGCLCRPFRKRDINLSAAKEENDLFNDSSYKQKQYLEFSTWAGSDNGTIQELPSTKDSSSDINSFFAKYKQKQTPFLYRVTDIHWCLELYLAYTEYMVLVLRIRKDQREDLYSTGKQAQKGLKMPRLWFCGQISLSKTTLHIGFVHGSSAVHTVIVLLCSVSWSPLSALRGEDSQCPVSSWSLRTYAVWTAMGDCGVSCDVPAKAGACLWWFLPSSALSVVVKPVWSERDTSLI